MIASGASWFETRAGQRKRCREDALLTMRVEMSSEEVGSVLILRV
jgi:hypothetical protein